MLWKFQLWKDFVWARLSAESSTGSSKEVEILKAAIKFSENENTSLFMTRFMDVEEAQASHHTESTKSAVWKLVNLPQQKMKRFFLQLEVSSLFVVLFSLNFLFVAHHRKKSISYPTTMSTCKSILVLENIKNSSSSSYCLLVPYWVLTSSCQKIE